MFYGEYLKWHIRLDVSHQLLDQIVDLIDVPLRAVNHQGVVTVINSNSHPDKFRCLIGWRCGRFTFNFFAPPTFLAGYARRFDSHLPLGHSRVDRTEHIGKFGSPEFVDIPDGQPFGHLFGKGVYLFGQFADPLDIFCRAHHRQVVSKCRGLHRWALLSALGALALGVQQVVYLCDHFKRVGGV